MRVNILMRVRFRLFARTGVVFDTGLICYQDPKSGVGGYQPASYAAGRVLLQWYHHADNLPPLSGQVCDHLLLRRCISQLACVQVPAVMGINFQMWVAAKLLSPYGIPIVARRLHGGVRGQAMGDTHKQRQLAFTEELLTIPPLLDYLTFDRLPPRNYSRVATLYVPLAANHPYWDLYISIPAGVHNYTKHTVLCVQVSLQSLRDHDRISNSFRILKSCVGASFACCRPTGWMLTTAPEPLESPHTREAGETPKGEPTALALCFFFLTHCSKPS